MSHVPSFSQSQLKCRCDKLSSLSLLNDASNLKIADISPKDGDIVKDALGGEFNSISLGFLAQQIINDTIKKKNNFRIASFLLLNFRLLFSISILKN